MKPRKVKRLDPAAALSENAARIVVVRVGELCSFVPGALDPQASELQHDMRIAAKRLRYVLEATGFCFGRAATSARRRTKEIQDLLGEIHDADVMLPRLHEHRRMLRHEDAETVHEQAGGADDLNPELAARAPHRTTYRGLEVLEVYLLARRSLLFERFVELWKKTERAGTFRALERAGERELERAEQQRSVRERAERAREELIAAERLRQEAIERAQRAAAELEQAEQAKP